MGDFVDHQLRDGVRYVLARDIDDAELDPEGDEHGPAVLVR